MRILIEYVVMLPFLVCLIFSIIYIMQKRQQTKYYHLGKWLAICFTFIFFFIGVRVRMMEEIPVWFSAIALTVAMLVVAFSAQLFGMAFEKSEEEKEEKDVQNPTVNAVQPQQSIKKVTLFPEEMPAEEETESQHNRLALVYERLTRWMDQEQAFLNPALRVDDVTRAIGVNKTYLMGALKEYEDCTFVIYVNRLRVEYAKHYLRSRPYEKLTSVSLSCGFASTEVFCRVFKSITGLTPTQFKEKGQG